MLLKGRGLLDSVVVANEVVEEVRRKKGRCIIVKADFEKAYDLVNWDFHYIHARKIRFLFRME